MRRSVERPCRRQAAAVQAAHAVRAVCAVCAVCAASAALAVSAVSAVSAVLAALWLTSNVAQAAEPGQPKLDIRAAMQASQAVIDSTPPDFTLLDRRNQPVRMASYQGKPTLVSFIYTGCFTICPTQTRALLEAVKGLERRLGPDQFHIVSIGFNQPFDSPTAMRAFAAENRIDHENWAFLSPHARHVEALTRAFGFSYVETPAGFDHILGVTVLDAKGRIVSQVYGRDLSSAAIGEPLRQLILNTPREPGAARPSLERLVDRVRILCTVYDADTGEYRYDWKVILEIIGGLLFFVSMAVYLWLEWRGQRRAREPAVRAESWR